MQGCKEKSIAIVEVKTINISDEDWKHIEKRGYVKRVPSNISSFLRHKITRKVKDAISQLREWKLRADRRICYLVICKGTELWLDCRAKAKIQAVIDEIPSSGNIEVIFEFRD